MDRFRNLSYAVECRINTDRFRKQAPKAEAFKGSGGMQSGQIFCFFTPQSPLAWVSESVFRQDIGQFHSPRMRPCKSADYFMYQGESPDFNLDSFSYY